ncbi:MAG TPA: class E sortase [Acidimicrobiales bacterium]|jgi:sortase A|nr:class E sortase [Acidimicrobiales bacterium]
MQTARVLGAIGRALITAGVLVLLFVVYQLWGTGIQEARAQDNLEDQFAEVLQNAGLDQPGGATDTTVPATTAPPVTTAPPPTPPDGDAAAHIAIPKIGLDKIVVEGVSVADLKRGPGHYPGSPMPGQPGNAAIAGHRTTYGAPFNRIDELNPGDEILVTTLQGAFRYEVFDQQIVSPDTVEVLNDFGDNRLTLTACNPKYSARQRIVVIAKLAANVTPVPAPDPTTVAPTEDNENTLQVGLDAGLSGERASAWPAVMLGLACALIWLAAWLVAKMVRPVAAYAVGAPLFFVTLYFFYESFSRLLPANF